MDIKIVSNNFLCEKLFRKNNLVPQNDTNVKLLS